MDYLSSLNEKQIEAVQTTEGYLRVIAGAGSGKTKLLVSRYAYLVKEYGIDAANILCVTFTNKAAGEMRHRIKKLIGDCYDTSLICTYHGFCVRVLREDIEKVLYPKEFQIIDNTQQKAIIAEIYQKFELKLDHASFEKIMKQIASYKSLNREYVTNMCNAEKCQILKEINTLDDKIMEEYLQHQKQIFAMDFNDLLYFTLDVFTRCPEVLEKWQDRLNYIQVDEFQDSSRTELTLIKMLSEKHKNLMIVGDPDQNIYEWRGSDVNLLVNFDKTFIPTKTIFLNQNYRSTPQILKCANNLIEKNIFRLKKDLFTKAPKGAAVYHFHTKNEFAEVDKIIETITNIRKETSCKFSDFAVLYRSGFLSRIVEKKFTENGIPYEIFGGVKFYQRMEIQDIMAYLRLIAFDDDISFKRIVNKPRRRFGRMKLLHLQELTTDKSLFEMLRNNLDDPIFQKSGAEEFVDLITNLRAMADCLTVSELIETLCAESGYEKYIRELGDMERFENLCEFKRIATEFEANLGEAITLTEFINLVSLQSEDDDEHELDMVKLMTIHSAKGLEFPNVFVIGFSEGIFPSNKTIEERKALGLEEERRLCYVAITRAEKRLFLTDSEGFTQNGKQKLPSRFLKEIGEENYIRIGTISKELQEDADRYIGTDTNNFSLNEIKKIGDKVHHPAFGEGTIVGYEKNKTSYKINFEEVGAERVVAVSYFTKERSLPELTPKPTKEAFFTEADTVNPDFPDTNDHFETPTLTDFNNPSESSSKAESAFLEIFKKDFEDTEKYIDDSSQKHPEILSDEKNKLDNQKEEKNNLLDGYEKVEEETVPEFKEIPGPPDNSSQPQNNQPEYTPPEIDTSKYGNLWDRDDVPKTGWICTGVTDLGEPIGVCEMCGHQIIRYVHHMVHPNFHQLNVGCICAGKLEGNLERAKQRENNLKSKQKRKDNFKNKKWNMSKNNNQYKKVKDHLIVLYYNSVYKNWKYSLDNVFCKEVFETKDEAMEAAFEALEAKLNKK